MTVCMAFGDGGVPPQAGGQRRRGSRFRFQGCADGLWVSLPGRLSLTPILIAKIIFNSIPKWLRIRYMDPYRDSPGSAAKAGAWRFSKRNLVGGVCEFWANVPKS